jgi:hypothetical protein
MGISAALGSSALLPAGLGFRNVLINGDMRINQRGSSYTAVGYTLDRWYIGVTGAYTVSQSTSTPPTGFQNFMRVQRTNGSSNTGVPQIAQSLETTTSIPLQGKQVTVSFYARAGANYSASSNILNWRIYGGTGTDQNLFSYTGQAIVVDQSVTLTTSWQRFTYTTTALTSYNEYGLFFFSVPTGTAGAADYFDVTGVQLEANYQPTPFEQRPIGVELQLCQRYYEKSYNLTTAPATATTEGLQAYGSMLDGASQWFANVYFKVEKRTHLYTVSFYNEDGTAGWKFGRSGATTTATPSYIWPSTSGFSPYYVWSGATWVVALGYGHYIANAEL